MVNQFLLHFFPLATILLFLLSGAFFFFYVNAIARIEKYMESNRPMEWEALGKPSIFSSKYSEENEKFRELLETENSDEIRDAQMEILWGRAKQMKRRMITIIWSAFATYVVSIFTVNYFYDQLL